MAQGWQGAGPAYATEAVPKSVAPRPDEFVVRAPLTSAQRHFRESRANRILDVALPHEVWVEHGFILRRGQKRMPLARRGDEVWYGADQVELRCWADAPADHVKLLQGGSMAGARQRK